MMKITRTFSREISVWGLLFGKKYSIIAAKGVDATMLKCGIYESDITPALGMEIPGYFSLRKASGIKERLYSEAVYFESDGEKALIISNDMIQVPEDTCAAARERIAALLGMNADSVMICATHSHTAGPVETWGDFVHVDPDFMKFLESRIVDGAVLASQCAREVRLSYAKGFEDKIAYYRDYVEKDGRIHTWGGENCTPFGDIDTEVGVLRIDLPDGTPYGTIVNYACHCDCVGGTEFSSDYPGEMRRVLRSVYGDDFMPVFVNGFCGNINHSAPDGFSRYPQHYRRMGRMLAADVVRTRELATEEFADNSIAFAAETMKIPTREPDEALLKWAAEKHADPNVSVVDKFYADEAVRYQKKGVELLPLYVQVIRIGEIAFYGMPGEIFVEFGKMLKEGSPVRYNMPANLANGCVGYVPIRELFVPGVYEARLCSSSQLIPDGGYLMVDKLLELAKKL